MWFYNNETYRVAAFNLAGYFFAEYTAPVKNKEEALAWARKAAQQKHLVLGGIKVWRLANGKCIKYNSEGRQIKNEL